MNFKEQNNDINKIKYEIKILLTIILVLILIIVIGYHKEILNILKIIFKILFCNNKGNFNNISLWLFINVFTIITISIYMIKNINKIFIKKQNILKNNELKQSLLNNQNNYKQEMINLIDEINPTKIFDLTNNFNKNNIREVSLNINTYRLKIKQAGYKLKYYDDSKLQGEYKNKYKFEKELNNFKIDLDSKIELYYETINKELDLTDIKEPNRLKEVGSISEEQELRIKRIQEKYKTTEKLNKDIQKENYKVIKSLIELINTNWNNLVELSNKTIKEREIYTLNKIEELDK